MGYISRLAGALTIDPPLSWGKVRESKFVDKKDGRFYFEPTICYRIAEEEIDIDDGTLITRVATHVIPAQEDSGSFYDFTDEARAIIREIQLYGSTVSGWLMRSGEENGDMERVGVHPDTGVAISEQAELRWPDGSKADMDEAWRQYYALRS